MIIMSSVQEKLNYKSESNGVNKNQLHVLKLLANISLLLLIL